MRVGLSSAASPDASLDDLLEACGRRGLAALELESGHAHALEPGESAPERVTDARIRAAVAGISLAGYRVRIDGAAVGEGDMAAFALCLGAPLLVPSTLALELNAGRVPGGIQVMAVLPSGEGALAALDALDAAGREGGNVAVAWDVDPGAGDVSLVAPEILGRAGGRLQHVRLLGGGPEGAAQEGRGVGALMARLALAGFGGTLALAPSSDRYRVVWNAWLGRRGGWGCGSVAEDRGLVSLVTP